MPAATNAASVTRNSTGTDTSVVNDRLQPGHLRRRPRVVLYALPSMQATIAEIQGAGHISALSTATPSPTWQA